MQKILLNTKIRIPSFPQTLISRKRLFDRLNQSKHKKLIVISAPAGYGKTSLIVDWLNTYKIPAAWYAIDENDNDPAAFINYLLHSVNILYPQINTSPTTNPDLNLFWETMLPEWLNDLSKIHQDFFLVLDDLHLITNNQIYQILSFILRYQPPNLHLILSGRADPQIPLAKLRSQNLLVEIVQADLNFSIEECQQYFRDGLTLSLSEEEIIALLQRTEGWISGLQMAGIALKNFSNEPINAQRKNFIDDFSASHRYILDFLMEEVLSQQPEETQSFLIFTSIPERFNPELCDYLLSESNLNIQAKDELSRLEQKNLFLINLDQERYWFRYHHLFRELLNKQLITYPKDTVAQLHRLVGTWFENHHYSYEAVEHLLLAGEYKHAAQLMERISDVLLLNGELNRLNRWVERLPHETLLAHPDLSLAVALAKLLRGNDIDQAEIILNTIQNTSNVYKLQTIQAYIKMHEGDYQESAALAEKVTEHLESHSAFYSLAAWLTKITRYLELDIPDRLIVVKNMYQLSKNSGNRLLASLAACQVGESYRSAANLTEGLYWLKESLALATDPDGNYHPFAAEALSNLGDYAYLMGNLEESVQYFQEALKISNAWRKLATMESLCRFALLNYQQGQKNLAAENIHQAEEIAREIEGLEADDYFVFLQKIKLNLWENHLSTVKDWIENRDHFQKPRQDQGDNIFNQRIYKYELVLYARYLLKTGQAALVLNMLSSLQKEMQRIGHRFLEMESAFLMAVAANQLSLTAQGLEPLKQALLIAQEAHIIQIFLEEELFIQTLKDYFPLLSDPKLRTFVSGFLTQDSLAEHGLADDPLQKFLSKREIDVLNLLDSNLNTNEISQKLFVSPSTVQSHIKRIYVKLDVHSRWEAVQRAKQIRAAENSPQSSPS